MKKVLIVPDSFKGTLSSREVCDIMGAAVQRRFPELENRHVDFLKRDIIKAMNKAAALDELIPGLLSEYIEQSG